MEALGPSIPLPAYTGTPRADDRNCINGMLYVLMSGCRWMDMPTKYGSYKTVWERHKKWSVKGVWKNIMKSLVSRGYSSGLIKIDDLSVDSSTVEPRGGQQIGFDGHKKTKGSKIHVAVTPQCLPIAIDLGPGNEHESRKLIPLLNDIQITNNNGRTTREQTRTCLG